MSLDRVDAVVVGAGVVGLACAKYLAERGYQVIVLEQHETFGTQTSARHSEVIHAGIYYPQHSLKADLCLRGREQLYDYCESRHIPYWRCGKLIVAHHSDQLGHLQLLAQQAEKNGVALMTLSVQEIQSKEPSLDLAGALFSSQTGIVDSDAYMLSLLGDLEAAGGILAVHSPFIEADYQGDRFVLRIGGDSPCELACDFLINASGLDAVRTAERVIDHRGEMPMHSNPLGHRQYYAKGSYFSYGGTVPFRHLIYPIPEPGGLGIHLTLDMAKQARFGPDVEWISEINYDISPTKKQMFYESIRQWWPSVKLDALYPAYSGIRPKIVDANAGEADFCIEDARLHGMSGLVNLYGIESPGVTASLAIAHEVVSRLI